MIEKHTDGTTYFEFPHLAGIPGLVHGVFTRKGGHSKGVYAGLNVGRSVGDCPEAVGKNLSTVARVMAGSKLFFLHQVHGTDIIHYEASPEDDAALPSPRGDAVITKASGVNLVIKSADCQSVMLYDPTHRAIGNIHSGWRGSIANIIGQTVQEMTRRFGTRPQEILAGIGPSLGPCCAEFIHYKREIPEALWRYKNNNRHFDFWAISRDQLTDAGVHPDHIQNGALCTRCRTDLFYSYRAEKTTGRFAAVIGLRDPTQETDTAL